MPPTAADEGPPLLFTEAMAKLLPASSSWGKKKSCPKLATMWQVVRGASR